MTGETRGITLLLAVMLCAGAIGWWLQLRPDLRVEPSRLMTLPEQIGPWRGQGIPLRDAVEQMLEADYNLQRLYENEAERAEIWLYVGYYGTRRGGHPEHTPAECYPSAGWKVESHRAVTIDAERGLRVNEFVVDRQGELRLVYFWYRSQRSTGLLDWLDASVDRIRGRLSDGRADGALVRVSTPIPPGEEEHAAERLADFARRLDRLLDTHWPMEFRAG